MQTKFLNFLYNEIETFPCLWIYLQQNIKENERVFPRLHNKCHQLSLVFKILDDFLIRYFLFRADKNIHGRKNVQSDRKLHDIFRL